MRRSSTRGLPRASKYASRPRDWDRMGWVKTLPCLASGMSQCFGPIEADHAGLRGVGMKANDDTCIALCQKHHRERGDFSGVFREWDRGKMRMWLDSAIENTRRLYDDYRTPPTGTERIQGDVHYAWKGDDARTTTKRERAHRRYQPTPCELCGEPGIDRHHRDGDTGNNSPDNVEVLCRRCHMIEDGRLPALIANQKLCAERLRKPPRLCRICKRMSPPKRMWKDRCHTCHEFWRRNGRDRPFGAANVRSEIARIARETPCSVCGVLPNVSNKTPCKGMCYQCYRKARYHLWLKNKNA